MLAAQHSHASMAKRKNNTSVRWLAVVTVAFICAITLAPPLQHYFTQRAQINSLRAQVNDSNKELERAREELAKWNDPEYVATQARQRLHFVFPGERQYVVLDVPKSSAEEAAPAAPISTQIPNGLPWYGRLIASITTTNVDR
ncbi:MAG: septum formation initiator family protein [Actinobacteria bacterium]|nr:septum formation initiator family protein [Actinomycetota bacterium]